MTPRAHVGRVRPCAAPGHLLPSYIQIACHGSSRTPALTAPARGRRRRWKQLEKPQPVQGALCSAGESDEARHLTRARKRSASQSQQYGDARAAEELCATQIEHDRPRRMGVHQLLQSVFRVGCGGQVELSRQPHDEHTRLRLLDGHGELLGLLRARGDRHPRVASPYSHGAADPRAEDSPIGPLTRASLVPDQTASDRQGRYPSVRWPPLGADPGYRGREMSLVQQVVASLFIDPGPDGPRIQPRHPTTWLRSRGRVIT